MLELGSGSARVVSGLPAYMSYRFGDSLLASSQHNLYVLLCVQCYTPDDEQRKCPKHVEFYSKNKFQKLLHLVGFNIRICNDARSPERHIPNMHSALWPLAAKVNLNIGIR